MGLRKTHERGQTQPGSACLAAACRQSGLEAGRKQVFSGSDGGLGRGIWTGLWWVMPFTDAFTGFSTSSALTLWNHFGLLSEHSKPLPAWCALPLLLYSTQQLHPFTIHNSCGHSPFSMRTSSWVACARSCHPCSCGRCFIQSWQHGISGCQESQVGWRQKEDHLPIGQVQWKWFFSSISSLLLRLLSDFSPYYEPPSQVSRSCIHDFVEAPVMLHYNHRRDNNVDVFELTAHNCLSRTHQTTVYTSSHNLTNHTQHQAAHGWLNKHSPWTA